MYLHFICLHGLCPFLPKYLTIGSHFLNCPYNWELDPKFSEFSTGLWDHCSINTTVIIHIVTCQQDKPSIPPLPPLPPLSRWLRRRCLSVVFDVAARSPCCCDRWLPWKPKLKATCTCTCFLNVWWFSMLPEMCLAKQSRHFSLGSSSSACTTCTCAVYTYLSYTYTVLSILYSLMYFQEFQMWCYMLFAIRGCFQIRTLCHFVNVLVHGFVHKNFVCVCPCFIKN